MKLSKRLYSGSECWSGAKKIPKLALRICRYRPEKKARVSGVHQRDAKEAANAALTKTPSVALRQPTAWKGCPMVFADGHLTIPRAPLSHFKMAITSFQKKCVKTFENQGFFWMVFKSVRWGVP
jgi:hypothetical protein